MKAEGHPVAWEVTTWQGLGGVLPVPLPSPPLASQHVSFSVAHTIKELSRGLSGELFQHYARCLPVAYSGPTKPVLYVLQIILTESVLYVAVELFMTQNINNVNI